MWVAVAGIGGALVTGFLAWLTTRRQDHASAEHLKAQAADVIQDAAVDLLQPLREQVQELSAQRTADHVEIVALRSEVDAVRARLGLTRRHVAALVAWIDDGAPPPPPVIPRALRDLISDLKG